MSNIRLRPTQGQMACLVSDIPAFPGDTFGLGFPEAIGDAAATMWAGKPRIEWRDAGDGAWTQHGSVPGELSYTITLTPAEDHVDAHLRLTNESKRDWAQSLAFNCLSAGGPASIRDHDCIRHWVGSAGRPRRLIEVPRKYGPRPTIQLYSVEGAPRGEDIPFVANFQATPDAVLEGWIAIMARDGRRLVATASKPALFLFQNMEYSCIHASPGAGPIKAGGTGEALTRLYFVEASLEDWYRRVRAEMLD